jgi:hypothetical protein
VCVVQSFSKFYSGQFNGRRLTWQHALATVVLRGHFPKGRKELAVSGFQAAVLLAFNAADSLSFKQIHKATALGRCRLSAAPYRPPPIAHRIASHRIASHRIAEPVTCGV